MLISLCFVPVARSKFGFLKCCSCKAYIAGSLEGGRWGIGQGFDRLLWPGRRAFELSCCSGGRDF